MSRILIIEDERQIREVLKQILERAGYEVDTAEDGRLGLEHFNQQPADMVITDILMPNKDGLETIEELIGQNPNLPIIAISGGGPGEKAQFALDVAKMCGAVRVLAKPFSRKEILEMVTDLLATGG
ncbi:MAG: response regulator [Magnetococcales bacterium]|nr:response regulator [Magnetococcales bacterium]MBF0149314.1 response regulator [Magnetococcales bacterium]MBF0172325.1 response regulator [Magnetococcales bacterium]MBF0348525.1 response regulator [Magnetococcales bacterium]MBF0630658.1 response regulator [Magnetococcales bacterium]